MAWYRVSQYFKICVIIVLLITVAALIYSTSALSRIDFRPTFLLDNKWPPGVEATRVSKILDRSTRAPDQINTTATAEQSSPSVSLNRSSSVSIVRKTRYHNNQDEYRRNYIRGMMKHSWRAYAQYAWGFNEVKPLAKSPNAEGVFGGAKLGASIVDAIDTLYIMNLSEEYLAARTWIENEMDFNTDSDLIVFETNIRYVGGLLSMYALTKDQMFLNKSIQVADKLLPAFETSSGIPHTNVNMLTGYAHSSGAAILSQFGSMHLEFIYLSHVTGDPKYRQKVLKIRDVIREATPRSDGLYNNYMSIETGRWLTNPTHISIGGMGDSFYEYLIKAYVQSGGQDREAYRLYVHAIDAIHNKLLFKSAQSGLLYFAELTDTSIRHRMGLLACFTGGMLALGASKMDEPLATQHMTLAKGIAETCHESCTKTRSQLCPEVFSFSGQIEAVAFGYTEKYYILRPEIIETYFYLWRYTHDLKYRAWAWDFIEAIERHCKAEVGYTGLRNVDEPDVKDDVQQSFFLAEVLKYAYLIFSDDDTINLEGWVFNTEAHPLPIMKQS